MIAWLNSTFTSSGFKVASFVAILQECEAFKGGTLEGFEPYEIITRYLTKLKSRLLCKFNSVNSGALNQIIHC